MAKEYTVGRVAELAGVTVRTLHHYDEIALVVPSGRTAAGYRVYEPAEIERLTRVLTYRNLGFSLEQVAELLDNPTADHATHLRRQRQLLVERGARLAGMVAAIDKELEAKATGMQLTPEEQLEVFGTDKIGGDWAEEAEQRWGETDAFRESQRRTASYTKEDWERLKIESDDGLRGFADAMREGCPPTVRKAGSSPSSTGSSCAAGSMTAATRCTGTSPRRMSRTSASRQPSKSSLRASRRTSGTRSSRMRRHAGADRLTAVGTMNA
jgi:DNA-binding transcriptional MerR regulator